MPAAAPVLVLTGPPGSGKTTVARLLAERAPRGVHLEADRFFDFVRGGAIEPWLPASHSQNETAIRAAGRAAASYAAAGYLTVVDGIVIPRHFLGTLHEELDAAGLETHYAVLRAPLADCIARVRHRSDPEMLSDPAVVEQLWTEFEDLGEHAGHAVETAGLSPVEVADILEARLPDGDMRL